MNQVTTGNKEICLLRSHISSKLTWMGMENLQKALFFAVLPSFKKSCTQRSLTALRAIALVEPFVAGKHLIESLVIKRASQLQHLVAIDHVPPSAASLHPHVADEFIGRLDST